MSHWNIDSISEQGYFYAAVYVIKRKYERNTPEYIHRAMCESILPRWNDFNRDYKSYQGFRDCQSMESFLASLFDVEPQIIQTILKALEEFRNQNGEGVLSACLCKKIVI